MGRSSTFTSKIGAEIVKHFRQGRSYRIASAMKGRELRNADDLAQTGENRAQAGLVGASRRKWIATTVRDRAARPAPYLVERNFSVIAPNRRWVADITYIPT